MTFASCHVTLAGSRASGAAEIALFERSLTFPFFVTYYGSPTSYKSESCKIMSIHGELTDLWRLQFGCPKFLKFLILTQKGSVANIIANGNYSLLLIFNFFCLGNVQRSMIAETLKQV